MGISTESSLHCNCIQRLYYIQKKHKELKILSTTSLLITRVFDSLNSTSIDYVHKFDVDWKSREMMLLVAFDQLQYALL